MKKLTKKQKNKLDKFFELVMEQYGKAIKLLSKR